MTKPLVVFAIVICYNSTTPGCTARGLELTFGAPQPVADLAQRAAAFRPIVF